MWRANEIAKHSLVAAVGVGGDVGIEGDEDGGKEAYDADGLGDEEADEEDGAQTRLAALGDPRPMHHRPSPILLPRRRLPIRPRRPVLLLLRVQRVRQ